MFGPGHLGLEFGYGTMRVGLQKVQEFCDLQCSLTVHGIRSYDGCIKTGHSEAQKESKRKEDSNQVQKGFTVVTYIKDGHIQGQLLDLRKPKEILHGFRGQIWALDVKLLQGGLLPKNESHVSVQEADICEPPDLKAFENRQLRQCPVQHIVVWPCIKAGEWKSSQEST